VPEEAVEGPAGFQYRRDFITMPEEAALVEALGHVVFEAFTLRGVVARRRVAFFGESYSRETRGPLPPFLAPLRIAIAAWAGVEPAAFAMALVNEYRPGAAVGWHRDAPQYERVAGVSLLSVCRMTFRPYLAASPRPAGGGPRRATHVITLQPRSAYLMTGEARSAFEHHVPPVAALRYSITFRTLRSPRTQRVRR